MITSAGRRLAFSVVQSAMCRRVRVVAECEEEIKGSQAHGRGERPELGRGFEEQLRRGNSPREGAGIEQRYRGLHPGEKSGAGARA